MEKVTEEKRLNIGLFIDTFFPMVDGVIMVVDNYARRLSEKHNVTVFTANPKKAYDDTKLPYKVVRCPRLRMYGMDYDIPLPRLGKKFNKIVNSSNLDIVHIHSPFGVGKTGIRYARKNNIPVVATMHSQYYKEFLKETHNFKLLAKILLKNAMKAFNACDECWTVNKNVAEIYHKEYGANTRPLVRNNGTDLNYLKDFKDKNLKKEYNISKDEKVFLFVGRLTFLKNIDFIVRSLKIAKDAGLKFKMLFVGAGPDREKLEELIKQLELENNVLLLGKIMDRQKIAELYALADLFLFPSLCDCNSLVQIEAASQKTPTVFIKGSATACSVEDNINGYLSEYSEEAYANKLLEIFKDEKKYQEVCDNAFKDLYVSWDDCVRIALDDYTRHINKLKK